MKNQVKTNNVNSIDNMNISEDLYNKLVIEKSTNDDMSKASSIDDNMNNSFDRVEVNIKWQEDIENRILIIYQLQKEDERKKVLKVE